MQVVITNYGLHQLLSCDVQLSRCALHGRPVTYALLQVAAWAEVQHQVAVAACRSFYGDPIPGHVLAERLATYSHLFNLYWSVAGSRETPCPCAVLSEGSVLVLAGLSMRLACLSCATDAA